MNGRLPVALGLMFGAVPDLDRSTDTVEIDFVPIGAPEPIKPVPIRMSTTFSPTEDTDATITHLGLVVEIPQPDAYVSDSVQTYITSMLRSRSSDVIDRDPMLRSIRNNRSAAVASLKSLFIENPPGTYDIYCTFHLKAAPLEKNLVARTRVQVEYRGRFFDQPTNFLR